MRHLLRDLADHWTTLRMHLDACDARIEAHEHQDEQCVRLRAIIGVGPITADAAVATVGNAGEFKHGRQMAAWLGLVPPRNTAAVGTHGWAQSAAAAMRTCARC